MSTNNLLLIYKHQSFVIQFDEATNVAKEAHLIAYVKSFHDSSIKEDFLFCKAIQGCATTADLFNIINYFFVNNDLKWESCLAICTDRAPSMTGGRTGLKGPSYCVESLYDPP